MCNLIFLSPAQAVCVSVLKNRIPINWENALTPKSIYFASILCPISTINFLSKATFSSSSLNTISDPQTNSILNALYNFLPHTQNPNNIVNLICLNLKEGKPKFSLLHEDINGILPHLGTEEIFRVLLRCQSDSSTALGFFYWVKNDLGIKPNAHNYCLMVNILAWSRNFSQAMTLLLALVEFNRTVSNYTDVFKIFVENWFCILMIVVGSQKGRLKHAVYLYNIMYRRGVLPDLVTYTALINGYCKDMNMREAHQLFHCMFHEGLSLDVVSYNTLICGCCKEGMMQEARVGA